jgi:hypothetical protein
MKKRPRHARSVEKFDALVRRYNEILQSSTSEHNRQARLQKLIEGFGGLLNRSQEVEARQADRNLRVFLVFMDGYQESRALWAKAQEATADDFNFLEVMNVVGDENRHSNILAWLLDQRIEHGTHAQGNLGFKLFLKVLAGKLILPIRYANTEYWVRREVAGEESRIDVEVAARGIFIVHIENKIWTKEGETQTNCEWGDLLLRAKALGIPEANVRAVFLTPNGRRPTDKNFIPISWDQIASVLDKFAEEAKPRDVRLFANHYAKALRSSIITEPDTMEEDNVESTL